MIPTGNRVSRDIITRAVRVLSPNKSFLQASCKSMKSIFFYFTVVAPAGFWPRVDACGLAKFDLTPLLVDLEMFEFGKKKLRIFKKFRIHVDGA